MEFALTTHTKSEGICPRFSYKKWDASIPLSAARLSWISSRRNAKVTFDRLIFMLVYDIIIILINRNLTEKYTY